MKLFLFSTILILVIAITGCKKDDPISGCTDPNALNYDDAATEDDGTCTFNNSAVLSFWQDFANSQNLSAANSSPLISFYIDGIEVGSMANNTYSAAEPPCGNGGFVETVVFGTTQTGTVQYEIRYYDGSNWLVFQNGNINVSTNSCTTTEIVF